MKELGTNKASALGRTPGSGPIDAAAAVSKFLGGATSTGGTGTNNNATAAAGDATDAADMDKRGLLGNLLGGAAGGKGQGATTAGTKTPKGTTEAGVAAGAGTGAQSGLPTCSDSGVITMTYHQVNQDGAGPLMAMIDATSGGTDATAFKAATVMQNVPGIGIGGLSTATTTDFPVMVQMPAGMTCSGSVGGASNVCIVRMNNAALAGPFGGSAAFVQSAGAKKRAVEFNLRKRHFARGILKNEDAEEQ